jgi:hypothetical protein
MINGKDVSKIYDLPSKKVIPKINVKINEMNNVYDLRYDVINNFWSDWTYDYPQYDFK